MKARSFNMRVLLLLVTASVLVFASCGPVKQVGKDSLDCMLYGDRCNGETDTKLTSDSGNKPSDTVEVGPTGPKGDKGDQGDTGSSGSSCSVRSIPGGSEIYCTDGTSSIVSNGSNGQDGQDGADGTDGQDGQDAPQGPLDIAEIIDPCQDAPGVVDEVLLKLGNGSILVLFASNANGNNPRLALLGPGNYMTSDTTNCFFTIDSNSAIINQHY